MSLSRFGMAEPNMLLTAEGGCLRGEVGAGRDRGAEFRAAAEEVKATGEADGPKMRRFLEG